MMTYTDESNTTQPPPEGDTDDVPQVPGGPPKPPEDMTPEEKAEHDKKTKEEIERLENPFKGFEPL